MKRLKLCSEGRTGYVARKAADFRIPGRPSGVTARPCEIDAARKKEPGLCLAPALSVFLLAVLVQPTVDCFGVTLFDYVALTDLDIALCVDIDLVFADLVGAYRVVVDGKHLREHLCRTV